jgi:hypothetical protein
LRQPRSHFAITQFVLALFALLATVVPDVCGLPHGRALGEFTWLAAPGEGQDESLNDLRSDLLSAEELEEEFDEDGPPILAALDCWSRDGEVAVPATSGWLLSSRRSCAHRATGPPTV